MTTESALSISSAQVSDPKRIETEHLGPREDFSALLGMPGQADCLETIGCLPD